MSLRIALDYSRQLYFFYTLRYLRPLRLDFQEDKYLCVVLPKNRQSVCCPPLSFSFRRDRILIPSVRIEYFLLPPTHKWDWIPLTENGLVSYHLHRKIKISRFRLVKPQMDSSLPLCVQFCLNTSLLIIIYSSWPCLLCLVVTQWTINRIRGRGFCLLNHKCVLFRSANVCWLQLVINVNSMNLCVLHRTDILQ